MDGTSRGSCRRVTGAVVGAVVLVVGGFALPGTAVAVNSCGGASDLDGDHYPDLAVGSPKEDVGGAADAGSVTVLFGLTRVGTLTLTRDDLGSAPEQGDLFGAAVAIGLVTGDACVDLVIGVPGADDAAGLVMVVPGSPQGLVLDEALEVQQGAKGLPGEAEPGDRFGATLATGILVASDEEPADAAVPLLLVGAPFEDVGTAVDAGAVTRFEVRDGIDPAGTTEGTQGREGYSGVPETGDHFGAALAVGSNDSYPGGGLELVGAPDEDVAGLIDAGVVHANRGAFSQSGPYMSVGRAEAGDRFGASVAVAPPLVACDEEFATWVAGAPGEDVGSVVDAGAVFSRHWTRTQGRDGVPGRPEAHDRFGSNLLVVPATASYTLLVGAPLENIGSAVNAGSVTWMRASCDDLTWAFLTRAELVHQASAGVPNQPQSGDLFGDSLGVAIGANGRATTVAVGVPGEDAGAADASGALVLIPRSTHGGGPALSLSELESQETSGISGVSEPGDGFGSTLSAS